MISGLTYDGTVWNEGEIPPFSYSSIRTASSGIVDNANSTFNVGQVYYPGPGIAYTVKIFRGFLFFDTSSLPDNANITSATLSLYVYHDYSSTADFNLTVLKDGVFYPHTPLKSSDYWYAWYVQQMGNRSTTSIGGTGYWNITLNSRGVEWIRKNGVTNFCLKSSHDILANAPTGDEYVQFDSSESGSAYAPKLYVTYTYSGCHYILHGPYYEDGAVASTAINVTVYQQHNSTLVLTLNGTSGIVDMKDFYSDQTPIFMSWPALTSANYTRIYYFLNNVEFDEVWIFICRTSKPVFAYQFTVMDFYGMQNPTLETVISVSGIDRIVERKSLNVANTLSFIMVQWTPYDLRFRCDQGVYTEKFSAENGFLTNLVILSSSFPTTTYGYPMVNVTRSSGTNITVLYADPTFSTEWIYFEIYHFDSSYDVVIDYTLNDTGNSYSLLWTDGENTTDYYVEVLSYASSQFWSWNLPATIAQIATNPWSGLIFPSLGTFPLINVDSSQFFGAIITLCVLGIFSYASEGVGCILSWIVAGIFTYLGWLTMSIPIFVFSGFVSILVVIQEAKRTEREL